MEPLATLFEIEIVARETLTPGLVTMYGGDLAFPEGQENTRPYVFANFVETLDGIVSYQLPKQSSGGTVSANKAQDRMVMGLLRAMADVVIISSSALRTEANCLHVPDSIFPDLKEEFTTLRLKLGRKEQLTHVIVTASGEINVDDRRFHTPGLTALIMTTEQGAERLGRRQLSETTRVHSVPSVDVSSTSQISARSMLELLRREYDVRFALYEGGPTLFSTLLQERVADELFLTFAPQIAGRMPNVSRLGLVEGRAFRPEEAPWARLISVKRADDYLLFRYRFSLLQ